MNRTAKIIIIIQSLLILFFFVFAQIKTSEAEKQSAAAAELLQLAMKNAEQSEVQARKSEEMAAWSIKHKNRGDEFEKQLKECMEGK